MFSLFNYSKVLSIYCSFRLKTFAYPQIFIAAIPTVSLFCSTSNHKVCGCDAFKSSHLVELVFSDLLKFSYRLKLLRNRRWRNSCQRLFDFPYITEILLNYFLIRRIVRNCSKFNYFFYRIIFDGHIRGEIHRENKICSSEFSTHFLSDCV